MPLKPVSYDDLPQLAVIHAQAFGAEAWDAKALQEVMGIAGTYGWLHTDGIAIKGFILISAPFEQAEILTLAIDETSRRQGIALQLVNHAAAMCRAIGARQLFLEVAVDNVAALALYRSLGFTDGRLRRNYYESRGFSPIDALTMVKNLD